MSARNDKKIAKIKEKRAKIADKAYEKHKAETLRQARVKAAIDPKSMTGKKPVKVKETDKAKKARKGQRINVVPSTHMVTRGRFGKYTHWSEGGRP